MTVTICIVSLSRSRGKTSLIEYLISELGKRGIKVATIKHTSEPLDIQGKDTWRHVEAGSLEVVCVTPIELITIRRGDMSLEDAIDSLHVKPDIILVEGFKRSDKPKILCAESVEEVDKALNEISNIIAISGAVAEKLDQVEILRNKYPQIPIMRPEELVDFVKSLIAKDWLENLPGLDCGHCKYGSCAAMAKALAEGKANLDECVVISTAISRISVDGKEIPLSRWPQITLKEIILGFLRSLKLRDIKLDKARILRIKINLSEKR
ncbi:MAG TPA: molybdopterin-guanine dinucleotide biosynthesis protein B [Nitrososphaeria archaeon]|nr:molybdopterin-guanine dinucleotide biosynthesis protein B [Nitrososphaeria archaeon]